METFVLRSMTPPLHYREYSPGPILAAAVECFWSSTVCGASRGSSTHRVLPDGCMDLLFDFTAEGGGGATVIRTMPRPLTFATTGLVTLFGVRFRPAGLSAFLAVEAAELTDDRADFASFWEPAAREIWRHLGETAPAERAGWLRELLARRADGGGRIDPFVQHCVHRLGIARRRSAH